MLEEQRQGKDRDRKKKMEQKDAFTFVGSRVCGLRLWPSFLLLLFVVTACSGQSSKAVSGSPTAPARYFANPVIQTNFPDPAILQVGTSYYAYATDGNGKNIQVARSPDLIHWTLLPVDALPTTPSWAQPVGTYVWAPDVIQIGNTYVMYYVARDNASNKQCVGVATGSKPEGPFVDKSNKALVCQTNLGGTIDPYPLKDGSTLYLYFKNDGNCCQLTTSIYVQPLTSDGLHVTGEAKPLISNNQNWEGSVIEAPSMFKHDGHYDLFFSANDYSGAKYAIGYATCQTATGPCTQASNNPFLASQPNAPQPLVGPGGETVFQVGTQTWMIYHAWHINAAGLQGNSRYMWLSHITWQGNTPKVQQTSGSQPMPVTITNENGHHNPGPL